MLSGHNHIYERSKPLIFNGIITDNSPNSYFDPDGQIYITIGTGGAILYQDWGDITELFVARSSDDYGFLNINLINNGKKISADFISNEGKVIDSFQISK